MTDSRRSLDRGVNSMTYLCYVLTPPDHLIYSQPSLASRHVGSCYFPTVNVIPSTLITVTSQVLHQLPLRLGMDVVFFA